MPVLLRATGAGSRQPARTPLQGQQSLPIQTPLNRRTSQLSVSPSTGTAQTVLQVHPNTVRRTTTSSTAQHSAKPATWAEKFRGAYKRFQLKRLFPLFFILIYMLIGAVIFWLIESGEDERRVKDGIKQYREAREMLWRRVDEIVWENRNMTKHSLNTPSRRNSRKRMVIEAVEHFQQSIGYQAKQGYGWDFFSSMYFAGTLFTTIGYGDIACVTTLGRIATVVYSLVGIPLMLITLNELGKFLYSNITGCVTTIDNAYLGILGIFKKAPPPDEVDMVERGGETAEVSSIASELGSQRYMEELDDDPRTRMSVKVAVGITFGWIFFCAALFKLWEDWSYSESIYFMYISLSTIGLGDVAVSKREMMVLCFVFVIVGLSLVSMCINVVQVALEDFYCQLLMKLIMEYQQKLAEGGGELGASAGMLKLFGNNKAAKLLMPLLSKEAKKDAMGRVEVEAKKQGIEIPPILQDLDEKSGMPKLFHIVEDKGSPDEHPSQLTEMVEKVQLLQEEAALLPELFMAHEAQVQTDIIQSLSEYQQTEERGNVEGSTQTEEDSTRNNYVEVETQTIDEKELGTSIETQTTRVETVDQNTATVSAATVDTEFQTDMVSTVEQEIQTWIAEYSDAQTGSEIETKSVRIQTPSPVIEMRTIQTDVFETRKSPSKMSSAKKKLRRAFAKPMKSSGVSSPAMSDWKEVVEEEEEELEEEQELEHEEGSVESLHWNPVDGMHAEKQLPVSRLTQLFNKNSDELRRRTSDQSRRPSSFTKKGSVVHESPRSPHRSRKTSE